MCIFIQKMSILSSTNSLLFSLSSVLIVIAAEPFCNSSQRVWKASGPWAPKAETKTQLCS